MWGATECIELLLSEIEFQSTRPVWGATTIVHDQPSGAKFQSTRPVWGATGAVPAHSCHRQVSIHAPRVGRDRKFLSHSGSTHSFNPRAPCGARLRGGRLLWLRKLFQSTRPVWGATPCVWPYEGTLPVSIHAPRVGRDPEGVVKRHRLMCFNPRAPCGARRLYAESRDTVSKFQSTRPVWGATLPQDGCGCPQAVSIHAPRVGRDRACVPGSLCRQVSIHAPRVGRDLIGFCGLP